VTEEMRSLRRRQDAQQGYVLLTLLLAVTLLIIAMAVAAQSIAFQIKRDREEELVHRGVQYSRAIRRYAKQARRYPVQLEDLRSFGDQRFIRKLYKDPITGGDFQPIYESDVANLQGPASLNPAPAISGSTDSDAANRPPVPDPGQNPANPTASAEQAGDSNASSTSQASSGSNGRPQPRGGPIFGVVSASKKRTIREFNHKNHYNEWLFFYDPNHDQGLWIKGPTPLGLPAAPLTTPNQPQTGVSQTP
jgi:type II secretory pathway pseudopilin PulG